MGRTFAACVLASYLAVVSACDFKTDRQEKTAGQPVVADPNQIPKDPGSPPAAPAISTFMYLSTSTPAQGLATYTLDRSNGALSELPNGFIATGMNSQPEGIVATPDGRFLYLADANQNVFMFSVDSNGRPTLIGSIPVPTIVVAGAGLPWGIAVHPSGKFLYVTQSANPIFSANSKVLAYAIDANTGMLTSRGSVDAGSISWKVAVHPSGKFAYASNLYTSSVSIYSVNPATGTLTTAGAADTGPCADGMAINPAGTFLYVAYMNSTHFCARGTDNGAGGISVFSINQTSGALTAAGTVTSVAGSPTEIVIDPSGTHAYVSTASGLQTFSVNATTGALSPSNLIFGTPYNLGLEATGKFLFSDIFNLDAVGNGTVSSFTLNPATGAPAAATIDLATGTGTSGGVTSINLID